MAHNREHGITPESIQKGRPVALSPMGINDVAVASGTAITREEENLSEAALFRHIQKLERQMEKAAKRLEFEEAAAIRDHVMQLKEMALGLHV